MTYICVGNLTIFGSNNGLSPGRRQAIIWTNTGILLIGPLGTHFSDILNEILTFSFQENTFESVVWEMARAFHLGLNVLRTVRQSFAVGGWDGMDMCSMPCPVSKLPQIYRCPAPEGNVGLERLCLNVSIMISMYVAWLVLNHKTDAWRASVQHSLVLPTPLDGTRAANGYDHHHHDHLIHNHHDHHLHHDHDHNHHDHNLHHDHNHHNHHDDDHDDDYDDYDHDHNEDGDHDGYESSWSWWLSQSWWSWSWSWWWWWAKICWVNSLWAFPSLINFWSCSTEFPPFLGLWF